MNAPRPFAPASAERPEGLPPLTDELQIIAARVPAGWYTDPDTGARRWWNGSTWTTHFAPPAESPAPARGPAPATTGSTDDRATAATEAQETADAPRRTALVRLLRAVAFRRSSRRTDRPLA